MIILYPQFHHTYPPSASYLALQQLIGHDLHVYKMHIWLANIFCLTEIHKYTDKIKRCKKSVIDHLGCQWLWMLQPHLMHTLTRTNSCILQLTWVIIVVGVYKIYCSNIECQIISEVYWSPESTSHLPIKINAWHVSCLIKWLYMLHNVQQPSLCIGQCGWIPRMASTGRPRDL